MYPKGEGKEFRIDYTKPFKTMWKYVARNLLLILLLYFIKYSAHFFILKMMLKYSLHTLHGRERV